MKLSEEQLKEYDEKGFLVFRDLFSREEVAALQRRGSAGFGEAQSRRCECNREGRQDVTCGMGARDRLARLCRGSSIARVLGPIQQIMGGDIYFYQSRLNYKRAHTGDVFQWHQDYQSWLMDGVPKGGHRDILSVLIMLDDTYDKTCGPLEFLAGSHKLGAIPPVYDTETTSYALHIVTDDLVERLSKGFEKSYLFRSGRHGRDIRRQSCAWFFQEHLCAEPSQPLLCLQPADQQTCRRSKAKACQQLHTKPQARASHFRRKNSLFARKLPRDRCRQDGVVSVGV